MIIVLIIQMHIMLIFFLAFAAVSAVPTPIKNYDFRNFYHGSPTSAAPIDEMNKGKVMLRIVGPFEVNCGSHGCYFDNTKSKFTHLEATVTIESGAYSILTWIYLEEYENTGDVFIKIVSLNYFRRTAIMIKFCSEEQRISSSQFAKIP